MSDEHQRKVKGYIHAFLLQAKGDVKQPAAQVWSADEKLQMTVYTTAPALQFLLRPTTSEARRRANT